VYLLKELKLAGKVLFGFQHFSDSIGKGQRFGLGDVFWDRCQLLAQLAQDLRMQQPRV
jgi:hypothetical protein